MEADFAQAAIYVFGPFLEVMAGTIVAGGLITAIFWALIPHLARKGL